MADDGDDYLTWFKQQSRRWTGPGFISLAGSAVSGNDAGLDELIASARGSTVDMLDGHEGLRQELAQYLQVPGGPHGRAARDCIVTCAGASNAILIALAAMRRILSAGGRTPHAVIECPTYRPLHSVAEYLGFRVSSFARRAEDGYRLDPEVLGAALASPGHPVLIVVSNLNNPTSAEASPGEILALLDAAPAGSYALVDETFLNAGRSRESVARLGDPRVVGVGSLSKDPGLWALRCGWVVSFGETLAEMRRAWVHGFNIGSPVTEGAAWVALGRLPSMNTETGKLLAANRATAQEILAPLRSENLIAWEPPARGCVIFPELKAASSGRSFDERRHTTRRFYEAALRRAKVAVVPGDLFNPGRMPDAGEANIRIGVGGPTEQLREGLARLAGLVREFSPA